MLLFLRRLLFCGLSAASRPNTRYYASLILPNAFRRLLLSSYCNARLLRFIQDERPGGCKGAIHLFRSVCVFSTCLLILFPDVIKSFLLNAFFAGTYFYQQCPSLVVNFLKFQTVATFCCFAVAAPFCYSHTKV